VTIGIEWMSRDEPKTSRRRVLLGIGSAATIGIAGCGGDGDDTDTATDTDTTTDTDGGVNGTDTDGGMNGTDTPTDGGMNGTGNVRVAHVSPDAPNVDVYVDGDAVLEGVAFGDVSSYLEVPAGDRQVEITAAGDPDTSVFSGPVTVEADTDYTVAAAGEISDDGTQEFAPIVLEDDNSEVEEGNARLRAVHASPDAPAVDITAAGGDVVLFDGVAFGQSGYTTVGAGSYTVEIRGDTESNDGDVVADFDETLADGGVYTAFAVGYLNPEEAPGDEGFDLVVVQDAGDEPTANVRVAHMSPDAPNVDVYVDGGDPVLSDVEFTTVSNYLEVPAGDRQVEITAAGDPSTSVFDGPVTVEADTDYSIVAAGEISDMAQEPFAPIVLEDDNSEVMGSNARLRAVHVSPDAPAVDITAAGGNVVLFDGVAFGESGYTSVEANDYTVQIRGDTESNDGDVVADFDVSLNGGTVYTAFAAGYLDPDEAPADTPFDLVVAQDSGGNGMN
jgi:hypothetical protein